MKTPKFLFFEWQDAVMQQKKKGWIYKASYGETQIKPVKTFAGRP